MMAGVFPMDDVVLEESHNGHQDTFSDDDCIEVVLKDNDAKSMEITNLYLRLRKVCMLKDQIFPH